MTKETKFTEGPWEWINSEDDTPMEKGADEGSLRTVKEYGENTTRVTPEGTYTTFALPKFILNAEFNDDAAGNAHLIASAPDLYRKVEAAAEQFRTYEKYHIDKNGQDCPKAKKNGAFASELEAILSEARGESHE